MKDVIIAALEIALVSSLVYVGCSVDSQKFSISMIIILISMAAGVFFGKAYLEACREYEEEDKWHY